MPTLETVRAHVSRYCEMYRHPNLEKLSLSQVYSLVAGVGEPPRQATQAPSAAPHQDQEASPPFGWPGTWPNSGEPGVYLVFDTAMNLLYVGKASMSNGIGARLNGHFGYATDGTRGCAPRGTWSAPPAYVVAIGVPHSFEAPALEEYLILELQPPDNVRGKAG